MKRVIVSPLTQSYTTVFERMGAHHSNLEYKRGGHVIFFRMGGRTQQEFYLLQS